MNTILKEFFRSGNDINPYVIPAELQVLIERWAEAIARGQIGFLPRSTGDRLLWYAFAPTARQRRELLDTLDGWIGPTFSDLDIRRGELSPNDPFDQSLARLDVRPIRFEVLPRAKPESSHSRDYVRNSLIVLGRMIENRPPSEFGAPRATVEVLDDLAHAIASQDRRLAMECLDELSVTADMDFTNLAFLRLRTFAGVGDWNALLADEDLMHVVRMRRPLGITRAIQHAVYASYLGDHVGSGNASDLRKAAEMHLGQYVSLATDIPASNGSEAIVEFLLAEISGEPSETLDQLVDQACSIEPKLGTLLAHVKAAVEPVKSESEFTEKGARPDSLLPLQQAAMRFLDGEYVAAAKITLQCPPSLQAARLLLQAARSANDLSIAEQVSGYIETNSLRSAIVRADENLQRDLAWLDDRAKPAEPTDWLAWFDSLSDNSAINHSVSAEARDGWQLLDYSVISRVLNGASDEVLGRLGEWGGQFMAAHRDVILASNGVDLVERVLAGLALSAKRSRGVQAQTLALLDDLTAATVGGSWPDDALIWCGEIATNNAAAISASWCVDLLQLGTSLVGAGTVAKQDFFFAVVNSVRQFKSALSLTDLEALGVVAEELNLELPSDFATVIDEDADPGAEYRHLRGQKVVLYSLTESAITRAAQVLRRLVPDLEVDTTTEHDGSPRLAAQAAGADVFVVVVASAKHAATNFIKDRRGHKPTILINSRGSSAILDALRAA
ncbi:hypothetical protein GCM10023322_52130 [Rugosimonospora acidiphila]|uniref:DUF2325 domain-containing protein n=1 Tax=Rugosimonospora acidiphila TaxID=556531 RepID=A0ABP9SAQ9_9ACTN